MKKTEEELIAVLDRLILHWREIKADKSTDDWDIACSYIDAYQSVRVFVTGEELP